MALVLKQNLKWQLSNLFTTCKARKRIVAEASDLGMKAGEDILAICSQLYDDAIDIGFVLVSELTGREVRWCFSHELKEDGELKGWLFKVLSEDLREFPQLAGYELVIYND